jgi:hypothetical protein
MQDLLRAFAREPVFSFTAQRGRIQHAMQDLRKRGE